MFKTIGKLFFIIVIVPKIVDNARFVRKHAEPELREMFAEGMEKMRDHFAEKADNHRPTPIRSA